MAEAQVIRDMGGNWLECQDSQGIFYHNQATQQVSETLPAELAAPAGNQGEVVVLRELPGNWLECQDAQGIYYLDQATQQTFDAPPAELMAANPLLVGVAADAAPVVAAAESAVLREMPNNWLECMDVQGIYYFNKVTQQSSDTLPAELTVAPQAAPVAVPSAMTMPAAFGQPKQAKVLSGGIGDPSSYVPLAAVSQSYAQVAAAQQQYVQLAPAQQQYVQAAPAPPSYTPLAVPQQAYASMQQQAQPTLVYQQVQPITSAYSSNFYNQAQMPAQVNLQPKVGLW